jgi:putative Holliday junction resolvase
LLAEATIEQRKTTVENLLVRPTAPAFSQGSFGWRAAGCKPETVSYNRKVESHSRILAIDYGSRRMGLAVSDPLGITAQGLPTLERKNKRSDFARLERLLREYSVKEIVLGNPLRMSGEAGTQSQKVVEFAEELRQKFHRPVHLWDERLTSAEANRLLREAEVGSRKRAQAVDRMAAVLILQSFLQARPAAPEIT